MDNNQFQVAIAVVATLQVVALAGIAAWSRDASIKASQTSEKVNVVHDLVNGLSERKDAALSAAATAQGELAGRDFEAAKRAEDTSHMTPVTIVGSETTLPVHDEGKTA